MTLFETAQPLTGALEDGKAVLATAPRRGEGSAGPMDTDLRPPERAGHPLALQLRRLLEAEAARDVITTSRGIKIDRQHYADAMGVSKAVLRTHCGHVFAEFEASFSFTNTSDRQLPQMREWLESQFDSGELGIRDGKAERLAFARHFRLKGGTFLVRSPLIRALFDEFDERIRAEGYLPLALRAELDRVCALLVDGFVLDKDRLTISRKDLAAKTGIQENRLYLAPFHAVIASKEEAILEQAHRSKIDPFLHGSVRPFSELSTVYPKAFLEKVGMRFGEVFSGYARDSAKSCHRALLAALRWIGSSTLPTCQRVMIEISQQKLPLANAWEDSVYAFRDSLKASIADGLKQHGSVDATIKALNTALEALSTRGIVPQLSAPLMGIKNARKKAGKVRSVAEALPVNTAGKSRDDFLAFASESVRAAAKAFNVHITSQEQSDFLQSLADESERRPLPEDPSQAILEVINGRLAAFQASAQEIFGRWRTHYETGQALLNVATIDSAKFREEYAGTANKTKRAEIMRASFPGRSKGLTSAERATGSANLLRLSVDEFDGLLPLAKQEREQFGQFFEKRFLELGSFAELDAYLAPHRDAVGAALTLYLCESGANLSVGRSLKVDALEESDLEDYTRITGYKARAQGRPIIVDIPSASPAVDAMKWLAAASAAIRRNAGEDNDMLFVQRVEGRCQVMTSHWLTGWFKKFAATAVGAAHLRFTPNMIRPSVLLKAALENDGRIQTGMALAQHTEGVTAGYQNKWPTRLLYDTHFRKFQQSLEALVARNIEAASRKLGVTEKDFGDRIAGLQSTGLGVFCADPTGRPGSNGNRCTSLDCWNDCPQLVVLAEIEAISGLQLWQKSLRVVQPEWERDHPERWDEVWLPWLCLADVVEEKMMRGPELQVWNAAKLHAAKTESHPEYVAPEPW